jgi:uncharacterized protein YecT (DUF1311 family)
MKPTITVFLLLMLVTGSVFSQKRKTGPCANPQTQSEMNQCAGKDYQAADAVLNQVYPRLAAMLDTDEKAQLKDAQTAWLKYRDANCDFVADQFKGGTIRPMIYANCLADMTRKRTIELRTQIKDRNN